MINKLWCLVLGHKIQSVQWLSDYSERVICMCCGSEFAINHDTRISIPWGPELQRFYEERQYFSNHGAP